MIEGKCPVALRLSTENVLNSSSKPIVMKTKLKVGRDPFVKVCTLLASSLGPGHIERQSIFKALLFVLLLTQ